MKKMYLRYIYDVVTKKEPLDTNFACNLRKSLYSLNMPDTNKIAESAKANGHIVDSFEIWSRNIKINVILDEQTI